MFRIFATILFLLLSLPLPAKAESLLGVLYVGAYDGDTITVDIPYLPGVFGERVSVRLNGIDTPEMRGGCKGAIDEKEKAILARDYLHSMIEKAVRVDLRNVGRDKYFRILADVVADGVNLNQAMLKAGHAVPYEGGTKVKNWCE